MKSIFTNEFIRKLHKSAHDRHKRLVHSTPAQKKEIDQHVDRFFQDERDEHNKMPKEDA